MGLKIGNSELSSVFIGTKELQSIWIGNNEMWSGNVVARGACGDNLTWTLNDAGLLTIKGTGAMTSNPWSTYATDIKKIIVKDGVTNMMTGAFSGCGNLESITIPFVGESRKTLLETYQYPLGYIFGTSSYTGGTAVTQSYYGSSTFSFTSTTYYIPTSLKSVTVTDGVIVTGAFHKCSNLTNVILGDNVESMGSYVFTDCSNLISVILGDSIVNIGYDAFYNCSNLISVTIPDSVTSIGAYAFCNCSGLTDVYYKGNASSWANITIGTNNECLTNATIHYNS